jgi:hypothetical protein
MLIQAFRDALHQARIVVVMLTPLYNAAQLHAGAAMGAEL